jgi:hypothetical protein
MKSVKEKKMSLCCPDCKKENPAAEFIESDHYKTKTTRGVSTYCKKHTKERAAKRRKEKDAECKEYQKDYRGKNRKELSKKHRDWVGKNRSKVTEYNREAKRKERAKGKASQAKKN